MFDANERFWSDLLLFIEEGKLVPVLGPDLLQIEADGVTLRLHDWLARRLAQMNNVDLTSLPSPFVLNDVVAEHVKQGGERDALYADITQCLKDAYFSLPPALLDLAGIAPLDLFVTLSFDTLLAQALTQVRAKPPTPLAYAHNKNGDLSAERQAQKQNERGTVVFHLFGKASSSPDFVICDEDMLEFVHALQDKQRQPDRLFDELRSKHLLILGCSFGDWLGRFFLRTARGVEFSQRSKRTDILVGPAAQHDPNLVLFLQSYGKESKVISMTSVEFAAELAQRWHAAHPVVAGKEGNMDDDGTSAVAAWEAGTEPPKDGAVFISYATEDFEIARKLVEGLKAAGVDCWFDRSNLEPGAAWAIAIERGIGRCAAFLPIISRASTSPNNRERYFWREWNVADFRARGMGPDLAFVLPVMVDDTRIDKLPIQMHDTFTSKQGVGLPGGQVTPAFGQRVLELQREFRRRQR